VAPGIVLRPEAPGENEMTRNEAIIEIFEKTSDGGEQYVYKTDVIGTGFYEVTQRPDGHSMDKFCGDDADWIAKNLGLRLQHTDHGAGRSSVQAFALDVLLADVSYLDR